MKYVSGRRLAIASSTGGYACGVQKDPARKAIGR